MSLSKQLYIIITFIFFVIFSGNFFISIKNTKEYLITESSTKAQDTAISIGISLKHLIKDKQDPEIESIIRAISNSGFYKNIRLEDANFTISESRLIEENEQLDDSNWKIEKITLEPKYGYIEKIESDNNLNEQLLALEDEEADLDFEKEDSEITYKYVPSAEYVNGGDISFNYTVTNENKTINTSSKLKINKIILEEKREIKFDYVPSWFIDLIPIHLDEKYSEISDGWKTTAIIYVSPNPGEAYAKLYEQAKNSIIYAIIAFIISIFLLFIFVQFLLRPLKKIEKLATDIEKGKFGVIKKLPWTIEIKNVAIAMNSMSRKIEAIINKLNKNLETLSKKLAQDELTGLYLKPTFETDMKDLFINKKNAYVFSIKINNLSKYAKTHTNEEINTYIKDFAAILLDLSKDQNLQIKAFRFLGSEFVLIAKDTALEDTNKICHKLQVEFAKLSHNYSLQEVAHIGVTPFNQIGTIAGILQSANEAYEKAKLIGQNEFYIQNSTDLSRDMAIWKELIFEIIDTASFNINFINDAYKLNNNGEKDLILQEAFTNAKDKDNNNIPIGTFVSIAEKYEKILDLDKNVILKVIEYIEVNNIKNDICINLSLDSISNNSFIQWLLKILAKNKNISSQLVFSITAYTVIKDIDTFKNFCEFVNSSGSKTIIKRFETKFIPIENLKDFNLDYIRLARDYTDQVCNDKSKKEFVESISELGNLLNIKVIAESVKNDKDLELIEQLNIYGASR